MISAKLEFFNPQTLLIKKESMLLNKILQEKRKKTDISKQLAIVIK